MDLVYLPLQGDPLFQEYLKLLCHLEAQKVQVDPFLLSNQAYQEGQANLSHQESQAIH